MTTATVFDFARKLEKEITPSEIQQAVGDGLYCWVDVEGASQNEAVSAIEDLGFGAATVSEVLGPDYAGAHDAHPDCLHLMVKEAVFGDGALTITPLHILLNGRSMVTLHTREAQVIRNMKRTYREDFLKFSKSPGFLIYEIADHLIAGYRKALLGFSEAVEQVQMKLFGKVNDDIFQQVSALTRDILVFRKVLLASRELMQELASRRSPFVSETTQPSLDLMAGTLERLGNDLATERDVLSETLNLYMGMTSHRASQVLKRLTLVSMIFLPLTFLCGVYGMNFRYMPEIPWRYAYAGFWIAVITIASSLLVLMKRFKWL